MQPSASATSATVLHSPPSSVADDDDDDDSEEQSSLQAAFTEASESLRSVALPPTRHHVNDIFQSAQPSSSFPSSPLPHQVCAAIDDIDRAQSLEMAALDALIREQAGGPLL